MIVKSMLDFTLNAYSAYIHAIKNSYKNIMTFTEYFDCQDKPDSFCLIRHDVDRKSKNALKMARVEFESGIKSTYYFRCKRHIFNPYLIKDISKLGHEIGYHYESLSDTHGDMDLALKDFENNLEKLRAIAPIKTISMHGRPFSSFDNRDLWRHENHHKLLLEQFGILGEIYLDIDYSNIAYISDTGRNWYNSKANIKDKVESKINIDFHSSVELISALKKKSFDRVVFQVHPERWNDNQSEWIIQLIKDHLINIMKTVMHRRYRKDI